MDLILYTKPGCHLCEALHSKLHQVKALPVVLELRDITSRPDWWEALQYEVPVLCRRSPQGEQILPRLAPRGSVEQLERLLTAYQETTAPAAETPSC